MIIKNIQSKPSITVQAPGRICLIGEHQDYFGLQVISGAFDRCITISSSPNEKNCFEIYLKNMNKIRILSMKQIVTPLNPRDYLQSGINLFLENHVQFESGKRIIIESNLPIRKGVSSSSALCTAWIAMLMKFSDPSWIPDSDDARMCIAKAAFRAEVEMFHEPGGMQDHIASAMGGLLHMDFTADPFNPAVTRIDAPLEGLMLADSGSTKDTLGMISAIRSDVQQALGLYLTDPNTSLASLNLIDLKKIPSKTRSLNRLKATLINRNLTSYAIRTLFHQGRFSKKAMGNLMNSHHRVLSHLLETSSSAIDRCCVIALEAGALGAKVIGSGGGGCVLIYAPDRTEQVKTALETKGFKTDLIHICQGVRFGEQ